MRRMKIMSKSGKSKLAESHYDVLRLREQMQITFCNAHRLTPLIPTHGNCPRCSMSIYAFTPANPAEYFGNQRVRTCPWCGRSLATMTHEDRTQEQVDLWRIKGMLYPDEDN